MRTSERLLVVASGGGHWAQMLLVRDAFEGIETAFATVAPFYEADVEGHRFYLVRDANRWDRLGLIRSAIDVWRVVRRERPTMVMTTGAAPGFFAVVFGKLSGARTVWLDSIANGEELSMSGRLAGRWSDLWLTQWPDLAQPDGPEYHGAVV